MAGKPQSPKTVCKHGHLLTEDNIEQHSLRCGFRRCLICFNDYQRKYKENKRRQAGGLPRGQKPFCKNGHDRSPENIRPGKYDCAICHRERELKRQRAAGAQPAVRLTREQKLASRRKWENDRRARKKAQFVESVDPLVIFERDNAQCQICYNPVSLWDYEVDHIIPLARGGEHGYANTQLAHASCNRKKHAKLPPEFSCELVISL
jgi:5-methylcytosine-specific restriction endonuclease McrA